MGFASNDGKLLTDAPSATLQEALQTIAISSERLEELVPAALQEPLPTLVEGIQVSGLRC